MKNPKKKAVSWSGNPTHLVLSTGEAHPPFIQEVAPGEIEKCVWDASINGYRCTAVETSDE